MQSAKYVIVGGGVAGTTAASTIRRHDPQGTIILIERDPHYLYSRLALPGYIQGKVNYDNIFLKDANYFKEQDITVLLGSEATSLDPVRRILTLSDGQHISYHKLLLATGSSARDWSVPGSNLQGIHSLRNLSDAQAIKQRLSQAKHVVIVGGGFITLDLIQAATNLGVATTVLIRTPHYWSSTLDQESGLLMHSLLKQGSPYLDVYFNTTVDQVVGQNQAQGVILSNGKLLKADLILTNIGVDFQTNWLKSSGLLIEGGIITNQYLKTQLDDVYAAGDVALFYDVIGGLHHHQGNWTNASLQGQIAGVNMVGQAQALEAVSSYSITIFGKNISFIGQVKSRPSIKVLPRGSARSGAYGRILVSTKDHRVVGATLINRFTDKSPLTKIIASQASVKDHLVALTDESVDLNQLAKLITKT